MSLYLITAKDPDASGCPEHIRTNFLSDLAESAVSEEIGTDDVTGILTKLKAVKPEQVLGEIDSFLELLKS